ncbi:MBL fold metallo-hydrolase [Aquihabitans sp. G128]|uniref:MBL fold metallo-hydrolase n=1 Tax=Aquihabitans sp. G128 TaxID=2849779 RepID=UPI001C213553|nr:MBL fold metallo-hydrolase [Aquihabitans sp. G128]QXC59748.1 MBL fold metallo-hydrolase [Aquihabitans sp. G128]
MGVTVEWFGCATFRVRVGDLTIFFDTYLDKAPEVPPVGLAAAEVAEADFLFISHAHFDHVLGADLIARATGATVVGNHEVAHLMGDNGVPEEQVLAVSGGETVDCGGEVRVRVLPALHSCLFAASGADSGASCLGDLGVSAQERKQRTDGLNELLPTLSEPIRDYFEQHEGHASHRDGGQLAYVLETPSGSLLVSASSGYWHGIFATERPDVAILAAAGRPNVDGEPHQGSMGEFLVEEARVLGSPRVVLCHHDPLLPPIIPAFDVTAAEAALRAELGDRYRVLQYGEPVDLLP